MTGVVEDNVRTFIDNWDGTGGIENSGDAERLVLGSGQYMESEVVKSGTKIVRLLQNRYQSGDTVILKYRHGTTKDDCLVATWNVYSSWFLSLGYVQIRVEST